METLAAHLAWVDPWLLPAWTAWGVPFSWLELVACVLSLAMVGFNLRVHPAGWPLAMASSVLYGLLFARSRLYGEAALQLVFVAMSACGWWQWLRGARHVTGHDGLRDALAGVGSDVGASPASAASPDAPALHVRKLGLRGLWGVALSLLVLWPLMGALLSHATDSDVPYWDALPTTGSLIGQWLLGRKYVDNWPCWLLVNLVSMALFAHKALWLTVWLYAVFALLSLVGWRAWLAEARTHLSRASRSEALA